MSTGSKDPEDIVKDGVGEEAGAGAAPISRDDAGANRPKPSGSTERETGTEAGESNKATGPAEQQDEQTADDRGLTTDSSPD